MKKIFITFQCLIIQFWYSSKNIWQCIFQNKKLPVSLFTHLLSQAEIRKIRAKTHIMFCHNCHYSFMNTLFFTNLCNILPSFPVLALMLGSSGPLVYAPNSKCNVGNYYKATIGFFDDVSEQIDQTLIFLLLMICMMIAAFVFLLAASISIFWIAVSSSCCW